jgi:hypothetical protein
VRLVAVVGKDFRDIVDEDETEYFRGTMDAMYW